MHAVHVRRCSQENKWTCRESLPSLTQLTNCWGKCAGKPAHWWDRGPWFVAFPVFPGVNTHTMADFELPTWLHWIWSWKEMDNSSLVSWWCPLAPALTYSFQKIKTRWGMVNAKNKMQERPRPVVGWMGGGTSWRRWHLGWVLEDRVEMSKGRRSE